MPTNFLSFFKISTFLVLLQTCFSLNFALYVTFNAGSFQFYPSNIVSFHNSFLSSFCKSWQITEILVLCELKALRCVILQNVKEKFYLQCEFMWLEYLRGTSSSKLFRVWHEILLGLVWTTHLVLHSTCLKTNSSYSDQF